MAKYGQFESYEPAPNVADDAYLFTLSNGDKKLFSGPNALDLKARLDAYDQAQPKLALTTADVGAAARPKLLLNSDEKTTIGSDGIPRVMLGDATKPVWQSENTGPSVRLPTEAENRAVLSAATKRAIANAGTESPQPPPPSIAREGAAPPAQPGPGGELGYGLAVRPDGVIVERKYVPGTKGISKEDYAAADANATAVRRGQTEQIVEGTPQSQEYLDTRSALRDAQYSALMQEKQAEQAALDERAAAAAAQAREQLRLATEAQARAAELDTKFKREEELRNKAIADYSRSEIKTGSPLGLLGALGAAVGAYAAVIGKTPNFAQQTLDAAIERDIRAQEAKIKIKGETKDTLIGRLRETGLSRDQAHASAKQIMYQQQMAQNEANRLKHAGTALEAKYTNIGLGLQQGWNDADEAGKQAGRNKVVRSVQSGFEHERAGTAGGMVERPVSDQLGTAQKVQNLRKGEADLAKDAAALAKGPTASPETRQAAGAVAEVGVLQDLAGKYKPNEGLPSYEARTVFGRSWENFADWVGGEGAGISSETAVARQDLAKIQSGLSSANSVLGGQGSMTGDEQKIFAKGMAPGATWGDVQRAIAMTSDRAKARGMAAQQVGEAGGTVVQK